METNVSSRKAVLLLLFLLQLTHILAENVPRYFEAGGTLSLSPTAAPSPITSILWRHEEVLVAEWIKDAIELQYYGVFVNRTELNIATGHLQISQATEHDKGVFSVELNNVAQADRYEARMIQKVPDPNVWVKPGPTKELYVLYCDPVQDQAETLKAAEPVSYRWKIGTADWVEFGNKLEIKVNETTVYAQTFTCQMVNPVSTKTSKPEKNPFYGQVPVPPAAVAGGVVGLFLVGFVALWGVFAYKNNKFPFNRTGHAPVSPKAEAEENKLNPTGGPGTGSA